MELLYNKEEVSNKGNKFALLRQTVLNKSRTSGILKNLIRKKIAILSFFGIEVVLLLFYGNN